MHPLTFEFAPSGAKGKADIAALAMISLVLAGAIGGCASPGAGIRGDLAVYAWSGEGLEGRRLTSGNVEITSTLRDEDFERGLAEVAEAAHAAFVRFLPPRSATAPPLRFMVFSDREQWARFMAERFPHQAAVHARIRTGGVTVGDASYLFFRNRSTTLATLVHEGWHQYVATRFDVALPAWLEEGLACTFESIDVTGAEPRILPEDNAWRAGTLREILSRDQVLPLTDLLRLDAATALLDADASAVQRYYAQVWALVVFLQDGPDAALRARFHALIDDIASGEFSAKLSAARVTDAGLTERPYGEQVLRVYFGAPPENLDAAYRAYLIQLAHLQRVPSPTAREEPR
ncbi:MAG: DUF1570 domain-containing protein [Phycisphaerae bacterium]|nr:DUF1570 domain-containing protein [Phycisphaerae bacterium]